MSFANLKKNRDTISKLLDAAQATGGSTDKKSYNDERLWKPTVDKAGNGYAVIRFLPQAEGEDLPWVRYWDHGFKGSTGRWYIEKSLTSIGQQDPVSELNSQLWNTGRDEDKETARQRKRRLHHVSNILVVSDSANPANEGKVFLYEYGKKIMDKIMDVMQPQFADETPVNPFDFWAGANFKLKIRQVEGYRNYDKSEFDNASELLNGDEAQLEEVYNKTYKLSEFTDAESYKSYDELKTKMNSVLGLVDTMPIRDEVKMTPQAAPTPMSEMPPQNIEEQTMTAMSEGNDDKEDTMSYFAKLANAD